MTLLSPISTSASQRVGKGSLSGRALGRHLAPGTNMRSPTSSLRTTQPPPPPSMPMALWKGRKRAAAGGEADRAEAGPLVVAAPASKAAGAGEGVVSPLHRNLPWSICRRLLLLKRCQFQCSSSLCPRGLRAPAEGTPSLKVTALRRRLHLTTAASTHLAPPSPPMALRTWEGRRRKGRANLKGAWRRRRLPLPSLWRRPSSPAPTSVPALPPRMGSPGVEKGVKTLKQSALCLCRSQCQRMVLPRTRPPLVQDRRPDLRLLKTALLLLERLRMGNKRRNTAGAAGASVPRARKALVEVGLLLLLLQLNRREHAHASRC